MRWSLTPARRRGVEILDDPATASDVRDRAMADIVRANALFGGAGSVLRLVRQLASRLPPRAVLVDVGTGLADIPARARGDLRSAGIDVTAIGVDASASLLRSARGRIDGVAAGDAAWLPFADGSADVVTCSQLLHHFSDADALRVFAEVHRVSRRWVVVSDLDRSWLAAAGFWIASVVLGFHAVTRHDGVTSVLRGFTTSELERLVFDATGRSPSIWRGSFWRLSAIWSKADADDRVR